MESLNPHHPLQKEVFSPHLWKTNHNNKVTRALAKFTHSSHRSEWYAMLTPSEVILLVELGCKLASYDKTFPFQSAKERKKVGDCRQRVFYFLDK